MPLSPTDQGIQPGSPLINPGTQLPGSLAAKDAPRVQLRPRALDVPQSPSTARGDTMSGDFSWEDGLVQPLVLQVPQASVIAITFVNSKPIVRPFIIRGLLITCSNPFSTTVIRAGYAQSPVAGLTDIANGFNCFSNFGGGTGSSVQDCVPMVTSGLLISPIYVPVDRPGNLLWASMEMTANQTLTQAQVTFFLDFTVDNT